MTFFKALGGGTVRKCNFMAVFLNPFSYFWKAYSRANKSGVVKDSNTTGEGLIMGGLMVVGAGNKGVVYQFKEGTFGEHAPLDEVIAAAKSA
mmetsp:Transcript_25893/g.31421  ORF Transcript_25893/g.31421 Transcript_25893/m.31421 type:complete len:92 (-) Transcript_25893:570-845(-)